MSMNIIESMRSKENERHQKAMSHIDTIEQVFKEDSWIGSMLNTDISGNGLSQLSPSAIEPTLRVVKKKDMTVGERILDVLGQNLNGLSGKEILTKLKDIKATSVSSTLYLLSAKKKTIKYANRIYSLK